jgi:hypothetical protein
MTQTGLRAAKGGDRQRDNRGSDRCWICRVFDLDKQRHLEKEVGEFTLQ